MGSRAMLVCALVGLAGACVGDLEESNFVESEVSDSGAAMEPWQDTLDNGTIEDTQRDDRDRQPGAGADEATDEEAPSPEPTPQGATGCGNAVEQQQLALTNAARGEAGVPPLACDDTMTLVARDHSQDMCDNDYFSHFDLGGGGFADRLRSAGVSFRGGGENIAKGQRTPESVHDSWMNSSGHRRNILDDSYSRIGIGYVECGGSPVWTQVFAD